MIRNWQAASGSPGGPLPPNRGVDFCTLGALLEERLVTVRAADTAGRSDLGERGRLLWRKSVTVIGFTSKAASGT